jgi:competence protein ComEC
VLGGSPKSFARETWLRRDAQRDTEEAAAADQPACDTLGCVYRPARRPDLLIALVRLPDALPEDCARADIDVSAVPTFRRCRGPLLVVDRFDLWRGGAHAVWLGGDSVTMQSVAQGQGRRPWSLYARKTGGKSPKS